MVYCRQESTLHARNTNSEMFTRPGAQRDNLKGEEDITYDNVSYHWF